MKKILLLIILLISAAVSAYIIYKVYPSVNPLGAVKLDYNSSDISEKGEALVSKLGLYMEKKTETTTLQSNLSLTKSLYDTY